MRLYKKRGKFSVLNDVFFSSQNLTKLIKNYEQICIYYKKYDINIYYTSIKAKLKFWSYTLNSAHAKQATKNISKHTFD